MYRFFTQKEINAVSFGTDDGYTRMDKTFMHMMDALRDLSGSPIKLTCAFRTKEHDISKGRSGNSDHCKGKGVDIYVKDDAEMLRMASLATIVGFNSFGYNKSKKFLHIGKRGGRNITTWNY